MSKKHFIALANAIREHNKWEPAQFTQSQLNTLSKFCQRQNSAFKQDRWFGYIAGENGPCGGTVKKTAKV